MVKQNLSSQHVPTMTVPRQHEDSSSITEDEDEDLEMQLPMLSVEVTGRRNSTISALSGGRWIQEWETEEDVRNMYDVEPPAQVPHLSVTSSKVAEAVARRLSGRRFSTVSALQAIEEASSRGEDDSSRHSVKFLD